MRNSAGMLMAFLQLVSTKIKFDRLECSMMGRVLMVTAENDLYFTFISCLLTGDVCVRWSFQFIINF